MDNSLTIFVCAFIVSGLSSTAALLRSSDPLSFRKFISSFLNSGMLGLGIALLWYNHFFQDLYFLIGLSLVAGLTGVKGVEVALGWAQKIAASFLKIDTEKKQEEKPKEDKKE